MTNRLLCLFFFIVPTAFSQKIPAGIQTLLVDIPLNSSSKAISDFVYTSKKFQTVTLDGKIITKLTKPFYYKFPPDTTLFLIDNDLQGTTIEIRYFFYSTSNAMKEFKLITKNIEKNIKGDTIHSMSDNERTYFEGYSYSLSETKSKPELTIELTNKAKEKNSEKTIPYSEIVILYTKEKD